jgi:hypothetical protein
MEINVTELVRMHLDPEGDYNMRDFSASQAELGPRAGQITWRAANDYFHDRPLLVDGNDDLYDLECWILEFGAWDQSEVDTMSDTELNALLLQFIAGDIREAADLGAFGDCKDDYIAACEAGSCRGNLIPFHDQWLYYVGC